MRKPRRIGAAVHADVDGDGRLDRARLLRGWRVAWGASDRIVVDLASGRTVAHHVFDEGSYRYPVVQLLGTADINADGRAELLIYTGGNTAHGGDIITYVDGHLRTAKSKTTEPDGTFRGSPLAFWGHGNSCGPWCNLSSNCQLVDGQPRLVEIWGESRGWLPRHGRAPRHWRRRWGVTVYKLVGARLVRTMTERGHGRSDEPLPTRWSFINGLSCGTARYPGP